MGVGRSTVSNGRGIGVGILRSAFGIRLLQEFTKILILKFGRLLNKKLTYHNCVDSHDSMDTL